MNLILEIVPKSTGFFDPFRIQKKLQTLSGTIA
jgi:starvation-inducible outer membrane lipoprotein